MHYYQIRKIEIKKKKKKPGVVDEIIMSKSYAINLGLDSLLSSRLFIFIIYFWEGLVLNLCFINWWGSSSIIGCMEPFP